MTRNTTPLRRAVDIVIALILGVLLLPILLILLGVLWLTEGRPLFYIGERMHAPGRPFGLIKLRTMRPASEVGGEAGGVTGGDKAVRMSRLQRALRQTRADEIPQLWNVLTGEMSFVGPRPPLRVYVEDYPELYAAVLRDRPGITGLASLTFHRHEERLLAACTTPAQTDATYRRRCIPRKARLDLIYQARRTLCSDILLMARTGLRPFQRHKPRKGRVSARKLGGNTRK